MSFIYIIRCENYVKVGRSMDASLRLVDMQIGCPFDLRLEGIFSVDLENQIDAEGRAHFLLKGRHHRGEWFETTVADATLAVCQAIHEVEMGRAAAVESAARRRPFGFVDALKFTNSAELRHSEKPEVVHVIGRKRKSESA